MGPRALRFAGARAMQGPPPAAHAHAFARPRVPTQAQAFARQLLESVAFMHDLQLVHTDLKPGVWGQELIGGWARFAGRPRGVPPAACRGCSQLLSCCPALPCPLCREHLGTEPGAGQRPAGRWQQVRGAAVRLPAPAAPLHRWMACRRTCRRADPCCPAPHAAPRRCRRRVGKRLPSTAKIRVIDFGSATFDSDYHSTIVCTRHYRWAHRAI